MKTSILMIGIILILSACTTVTQPTPETVTSGEAQIVNVGVTGASYTFDKEKVEAGKPVRLVFDINQLQGCSRAVTIPSYNVNKVITHEDNIIEFTPLASGPVHIICSMAMYTGDLMVE